ncbi:MAG: DUF2059 domain-containing protein [Magnetovibrio sp.]|nr:DUF2059 domain-containing protein [Magnetovibrio sp.]
MSFKSCALGLCLCLLVSAASPSAAVAGSKDKRIKIVSMMKAMKIMDTVDAMMPQMSEAFAQVFRQQGIEVSAQMVKDINTVTSKVMRGNLRPYLTKVVDIYDHAYSEQEIDDLVAFYKSPPDKKH